MTFHNTKAASQLSLVIGARALQMQAMDCTGSGTRVGISYTVTALPLRSQQRYTRACIQIPADGDPEWSSSKGITFHEN
jgi:hypothetical protein